MVVVQDMMLLNIAVSASRYFTFERDELFAAHVVGPA
jgi:hypothetical protein